MDVKMMMKCTLDNSVYSLYTETELYTVSLLST